MNYVIYTMKYVYLYVCFLNIMSNEIMLFVTNILHIHYEYSLLERVNFHICEVVAPQCISGLRQYTSWSICLIKYYYYYYYLYDLL